MDAEKFDKVVLDLLYDELDELTRASAIRHTEQSGRAKALYAELRATREVGVLPLLDPPADLEARILEAEKRARAERPFRQRVGAFVSIAASYAMRPQIGMAAVLLLMVGSSLLLLRVKPGAPGAVQVTERGVPESDKEFVAVPVAEPVAAIPQGDLGASSERAAPRSRDLAKAEPTPEDKALASRAAAPAPLAREPARLPSDDVGTEGAEPAEGRASAGGGLAKNDMEAPAAAARSDDRPEGAGPEPTGCAAALPRYEAVIAHPSSPAAANAARFAAADCYARLGRVDSARRAYVALLSTPDYAARARQALAALSSPGDAPAAGATPEASGAAAAKPASPAAKAAPER